MLLFVSALKLMCEIALMSLFGRFVLGLLAGPRRETNSFYKLISVLTAPFINSVRRITPAWVIDRHVPLVTFLLLSIVWVGATVMKINLCLQIGVQACR